MAKFKNRALHTAVSACAVVGYGFDITWAANLFGFIAMLFGIAAVFTLIVSDTKDKPGAHWYVNSLYVITVGTCAATGHWAIGFCWTLTWFAMALTVSSDENGDTPDNVKPIHKEREAA